MIKGRACVCKYCHITPLLADLHWLPVQFRIEFKILLIVFKIFRGLASSYLSFLIISKPMSRYNLRRSNDGTLLSYPNIKPKALTEIIYKLRLQT